MKRQFQSFNKIFVFIILFLIPFCSWSQAAEKNASKLKFQLGGGYDYSFLKDFNEVFVNNEVFVKNYYEQDLNFGWTINANLTYYLTRFLNVGVEINNATYHLSYFKSNLSYEDPMIGGPNFTYDEEKDIYLHNYGYGITTTLYLDQFNELKQNSKFNFGIDLSGNYVNGEFKQITTTYQWGKANNLDNGHSYSENVKYKYVTIKGGLNIKYNLNKKILHSIIFKCGFRQALNPEIPNPYSFPGESNKTKVDLSGFYANLHIELGWIKK